MSWMHMFDSLLHQEQLKELGKLIDNPDFLNAILDSGHSDIHYFGEETRSTSDWEEMIDHLYERDDPLQYMASEENNLLPSQEEVSWQLSRIVNDHVHCSTFVNREAALSAVHEVLSAGRGDLLEWMLKDNHPPRTLVLSANLDTIIGTGVTKSGNERASCTCTVVIDRISCHVNGDRYPFSIRTCYPDITNEQEVEGVWATGRNYAAELQQMITKTSETNQQRWVFDSYGEKCSVRPDYQGIPTFYMSRMCNGASYYVGINDTRTNATQCVRFASDEHGNPLNIAYVKGYENGISAATQRAVGLDALRLFKMYASHTMSPEFFKPEPAGYLGKGGKHPSFIKEEIS